MHVCRSSHLAPLRAQLFWSDGTFTADGLLDAWGPGEFGDHACAIIVGPNGANLKLRVRERTINVSKLKRRACLLRE